MPSYDGPIKAANTTANNGNANSDSHSNSGAVFKATNFVAAATTILIATLFF
jgi:hypothetical protein